MSQQAPPKCVCGAVMVQSHDNVERFGLTFAEPNGKFFCWPCSESRRDLLVACKLLTAGLTAIFGRSGEPTTDAERAAVAECQRILNLSRAAIAQGEERP